MEGWTVGRATFGCPFSWLIEVSIFPPRKCSPQHCMRMSCTCHVCEVWGMGFCGFHTFYAEVRLFAAFLSFGVRVFVGWFQGRSLPSRSAWRGFPVGGANVGAH